MRLTMKECKTVTKALSGQYRRASKGEKGRLLTSFVEGTGYNRCHAAWLLRHHGVRVTVAPEVVLEADAHRRAVAGSPRKRTYAEAEVEALKKVWGLMDYICGKRLVAALPEVVPRLVALKELRLSKGVQQKLMQMSASTIDRLLKSERAKQTLKGRTGTKPGTLLKHQVPIRTFAEWEEAKPGFLEMDLVGHDGGTVKGDYCHTLDITDVDSGWTEQAAVLNKAEKWVFLALQEIRERLPFAILGLDSDNGSEFINHHLVRFCRQEKITFTRSRPFRKNDTCYVEQKNWSIVRRFVGYPRYEGLAACALLNELYQVLRDYNNFFMPSLKLKEKTRDGARVRRRYEPAKTPYHRLMDSPHLSNEAKQRLQEHYQTLNPAALYRHIQRLQKQLLKLSVRPPGHEARSLLPACQSEDEKDAGTGATRKASRPAFVLAPESALGSLSSGALSSAQAKRILHKKASKW